MNTLLFLVVGASFTAATATSSPFLYSSTGLPVVEFTSSQDGRVQPDFLSSGAQHNFRLVEFYEVGNQASVQMKDQFLQTARHLNEIAAKSPSKSITIHAVSCTKYPITCQKQGITSYPTFRFYEPGSRQAEVLQKLDVDDLIQRMDLKKPPADGKWFTSIRPPQNTQTVSLRSHEPIHIRTLKQLQSDIHLSFDTAMRHFVYDHSLEDASKPLSKFQRVILKNWLILIHKTLPPSWQIHTIVKELLNSFMYVAKNRIYLLSILDSHKLESTGYSHACLGPQHDAVTCGVWEMFHAVSVGVVEYNKLGMARADRIPVEHAIKVMGEYVELFGMGGNDLVKALFEQQLQGCLGDQHCLKDPSVEESDREALIASWIRLPLWLSRAHTAVNHNVKTDKERRPSSNIVIPTTAQSNWPPINLCPSCWVNVTGALEWDEPVVYEYLNHEYTKVEKISPEEKKELFGERIVIPPSREEIPTKRESRSRYFTFGYLGVAALGVRFFLSSQRRKFKVETLPLTNSYLSPSKKQTIPSQPSFRAAKRSSFTTPQRSPSKSLAQSLLGTSSSHNSPRRSINRANTFVYPSKQPRERSCPESLPSKSGGFMEIPRQSSRTASFMDTTTPVRRSISRRLVGRRKSLSTALPMYSTH